MDAEIFFLLAGVWVLGGLGIMFSLLKAKPIMLLFGGIVLLLYGSLAAIGASMNGGHMNFPALEMAGNLLTVFFSVISSVMIGSAWSELRARYGAS
ncbi:MULTISPECIES: hypothetical protein [unclassified Halomonas]|uniref:hypothetical protein n=1 Tax=unclassified Halomonas TaxID=2609666 RepID=UPI0020767D75|nr:MULTISPECIES: hypothetical protein [unclassified Halomonas]